MVATIEAAGARGVAVHCVTRETVVLAASALMASTPAATAGGPGGGDGRSRRGTPHRLEHASVAPPDVVTLVRSCGAQVVTQPAFVARHGDRYLREVEPDDRRWLYRLAGWRAAGVPLGAGSDAPFGPPDPWLGIRAAVDRRTEAGRTLGREEGLTPEQAIAVYQGALKDPGGPPMRVQVGAPGDLCLLRLPWAESRRLLSSTLVRATVVGGRIIWYDQDQRSDLGGASAQAVDGEV